MASWFRRTGSEVLGWTLVAVGIALLVLPGPGAIILVAGVALLAPHYTWAQRILDPLHERAVEAGQRSVSTRSRVILSLVGVLWLTSLGVIWLASPTIPEFNLRMWSFEFDIGPELPGGHAVGVGLLTSGIAAGLLLGYSVYRWSPRR